MTLVFDGESAFLQGERLTWLAREAFAASRFEGIRFEHGHDETAAGILPDKPGTNGRQRA